MRVSAASRRLGTSSSNCKKVMAWPPARSSPTEVAPSSTSSSTFTNPSKEMAPSDRRNSASARRATSCRDRFPALVSDSSPACSFSDSTKVPANRSTSGGTFSSSVTHSHWRRAWSPSSKQLLPRPRHRRSIRWLAPLTSALLALSLSSSSSMDSSESLLRSARHLVRAAFRASQLSRQEQDPVDTSKPTLLCRITTPSSSKVRPFASLYHSRNASNSNRPNPMLRRNLEKFSITATLLGKSLLGRATWATR
mmetsp:Transcript_121248/g.277885  ORF Transcript_121248/g.277885 Transcript_121248/m.277885 type:complete len:252 (-) Transcript_121248:548-1303(-)